MERISMTWISATILAVLVLSGGGYYLEYYEVTGIRNLCADEELWIQQDDTALYYCPSEDSYQYCSKLSSSKRSCYVMEFIGTGEVSDSVRTRSTETTCSNGTCNLILYSGIRFVEEDGQWKKVENARSLKGKGFNVVYLLDDGAHKIDVVDFNMSHIELKFSYDKDNLGEFEFEIEEGKMRTKFKIIETLFNETTLLPYDVEVEQEIEIEEDIQKNIIYYGNPFGKKFKFGENSTTIMLQDADTENLEDSWVNEQYPDRNMGINIYLLVQSWTTKNVRTYIKFNISSIPSGQQISDATFYLYKWWDDYDLTRNVSVYHVYNNTWVEGSLIEADASGQNSDTNITWNNQPCGTAFDDATNCNLAAESMAQITTTDNVWINWGVTSMVGVDYDAGNQNVSFVLKDDNENHPGRDQGVFYSKEYTTDITLRPYLNITYFTPAPPVVNLDSPTNNTLTSTLTWYFAADFTDGGALVNATLNIWNSTNDIINQTTESITGTSNSTNISYTFTYDDVYVWNYESCDNDAECNFNSTNWTITIDTTPPTFDNLANQNIDVGEALSFDIDATDTNGISCFTVNDTTNFKIDCDGVLQNNTALSLQVYNLNITVNDTVNNVGSGTMSVDVGDTILRWDWSALMTDSELPDQICFLFRDSEYCFDNPKQGINGNFSVGPCWMTFQSGIIYATNCTTT